MEVKSEVLLEVKTATWQSLLRILNVVLLSPPCHPALLSDWVPGDVYVQNTMKCVHQLHRQEKLAKSKANTV